MPGWCLGTPGKLRATFGHLWTDRELRHILPHCSHYTTLRQVCQAPVAEGATLTGPQPGIYSSGLRPRPNTGQAITRDNKKPHRG